MTTTDTLRELVREERRTLIDTLAPLAEDQWGTPSRCAGWRVGDVAAHLAWAPVVGVLEGSVAMARHRFSMNRMIARSAIGWSDRGRDAILQQLEENLRTDAKPIGMPVVAALADAVVHGLDVRRPLALTRAAPAQALDPLADFVVGTPWPMNAVVGGSARRRLAGVRMVASDADWSWGDGAEVRASSEALVLVLYGRPPRADELTGAGADLLRSRLSGFPA